MTNVTTQQHEFRFFQASNWLGKMWTARSSASVKAWGMKIARHRGMKRFSPRRRPPAS
jgi:polyphosphate kinase 2 (PPK2 family)